jgi:hypothetical protein
MTGLTRTTRELVVIHDLLLKDFVSLQDIQGTLSKLSRMFEEDIEGGNLQDKPYALGLYMGWDILDKLHVYLGPHSQEQKLYQVLCDHLYGVYTLGSIYTLKAVQFKRSGPFLLLSIDTRWKIGTW